MSINCSSWYGSIISNDTIKEDEEILRDQRNKEQETETEDPPEHNSQEHNLKEQNLIKQSIFVNPRGMLHASLPVANYYCTENKLAERLTSLKQPVQIQKGYSQSKPIIKSADPNNNVIETSAKSQDESQDTSENHMMTDHDQVKPQAPTNYLKMLEVFESANHQVIQ